MKTVDNEIDEESAVSPIIQLLGGDWESANAQLAAREVEISDCMQRRGWFYAPHDPGPSIEPTTVGELERFRHEFGYGLLLEPDVPVSEDAFRQQEEYQTSLSSAELEAYRGDYNGDVGEEQPTPDSCVGMAMRATAAPIDDPAVLDAISKSRAAVFDDPTYQSALERWAACMANQGYPIATPTEAILLVEAETDRARAANPDTDLIALQELERSVAIADFQCAVDELLPVKISLERLVVQEVVERFPEVFSP